MYVVITIINHCGDDLKPSSAFIMYYKWAKLFVKTEYSKYQVKLHMSTFSQIGKWPKCALEKMEVNISIRRDLKHLL